MSESSFKQADARRFGCPGCGGPLRFDIRAGKLVCESCGGAFEVADIPDPDQGAEDNRMDAVEYVCPSCGAAIHTTETAATSFCSYCGSDVVLTERLARIARPARIVPFTIPREEAERIYRERLSQAQCVPDSMQQRQTLDHFRAVYIPYWRYTFEAKGPSEGRGVVRYTTEEYNHEDEYDYKLDGDIRLTGLLYDASSSFEDDTAQKLKFSMKDSVPFHPAYLCGLYAEAADTADVVYANALQRLAEDKFRQFANGKTGSEGSYDLPSDRESSAELVLMPVWLLANRQEGRVLYTAINGRSGEIVCDPPVSAPRFALLAAGLFAAILAALLLASHWVVLRPNLVLMICGILAAVGMKRIVPDVDEILVRRARDVDPTRSMKRMNPGEDRPILEVDWSADQRTAREKERKEEAKKSGKPSLGQRFMELSFLNNTGCLGIFVQIVAVSLVILGGMMLLFLPFILAVGRIGGSGWSAIVAILISDQSVLPPYALAVSFILLMLRKYTYRQVVPDPDRKRAGALDWLLLLTLRVLVAAGFAVVMLPVPGVTQWCYGLSVAILVVLVAAMLRLNRLHNEFVTRPVPIFGKGEKA